ncbi:dermatan-sulfate epimerase-like protein [Amphiura filiformis]|uniref:dermatan-sulfate epimerase-like protein n=1 Tax=Amphiura filiformis TaxID=82378 RepID=UPI003B20C261
MAIIQISLVQYFTLLVFLICLHTTSADKLPKLKYTKHPMLYYSAEEVEGLQLKALTTHAKIAGVLKNAVKTMLAKQEQYLPPKDYKVFGSKWNEVYGNNLGIVAFYCVLFPEDRNAQSFTLKYMDIMVSLPKWQVIAIPDDEVPVAHSLTGFTTAYDMLYPVLDPPRRKLYLQRIVNVTKEFYDFAKYRSWGRFLLQNHVATNYLALIHGSLVASAHYEPAMTWLKFGMGMFEKSMKLLNHIVDGSLDEGVAYGSYTSRSVTQYIFLALRHFDVDHTNGFWIKQHFWFYYNTILPHFQRTVGIADSNNNWFYGPESQLVFIDAYVLKNGYGNWLAHEIREHRSSDTKLKLLPAESQLWCTLHTEFIWYNAQLGKTVPPQSGKPDLHVFNDWGVVTFSHVSPKMDTDTFLAFKSGKLHGRGIFDLVQRNMYQSWVKGWKSFNPGHEHPDQNTFIFAPAGKLFITDGLYASKYSYLNNGWSFAPSPTSECFQPWEGQLGECSKWLGWRKPSASKYGAELITASMNNDLIFTSGEAVQAYDSSMKLESVYRSLLLVNHQILVVLDHIKTKTVSPVSQFSTFFHNLASSFEQDTFKDHLSGVKISTDDGDMRMFWVSDTGESPKATLAMKPKDHTSQFQPVETNYVNITMKLSRRSVTVAYVLVGYRATLTDFEFVDSSNAGAKLLVKTSSQTYDISIATDHSNPISRHQFLGYPGFASVKLKNGKLINFGANESATPTEQPGNDDSAKWFNTVNLSLGFTI